MHRFKARTTVVQPESFMAVASARLSRASGVIFCRRRRQASSFPPPAPDNGLSAPCMWPRCFPSRRGLTAECDVDAFRGPQRVVLLPHCCHLSRAGMSQSRRIAGCSLRKQHGCEVTLCVYTIMWKRIKGLFLLSIACHRS